MTQTHIILLILLFRSADMWTVNNEFPFIDKSTTIQEVRQFESNLNSEEIKIKVRIYSSETKKDDLDKLPQPIIFKRTIGLKIPIYVYYFFNPLDSSVYETNFDWTNLYTEMENSKNGGIVQTSTLPNYDKYKSEFEKISNILDKKYAKHSIEKEYGETRIWMNGTTQIILYLKSGQIDENRLRLTIKIK